MAARYDVDDATDPDTECVVAALRGSVAASGLTQAAFARALGTSASRLSTYVNGTTSPSAQLMVRAQRLGNGLAEARARGLMSAPTTAAAMRTHLRHKDIPWVWRLLLQGRDHLAISLHEEDPILRRALCAAWEAAPGSVGSEQWDGLLAAIVAHEFDEAGLRAPAWSDLPPLAQQWLPEHPFLSDDRVRAQTPRWLSSRNIFVPSRDLVTA